MPDVIIGGGASGMGLGKAISDPRSRSYRVPSIIIASFRCGNSDGGDVASVA
jgi:hypothetical protein